MIQKMLLAVYVRTTNLVLCQIQTQASLSHFISYKPIDGITVSRSTYRPACTSPVYMHITHSLIARDYGE